MLQAGITKRRQVRVGKIVPPKQADTVIGTTLRIEQSWMDRVDAIASTTGQTRNDTLKYLVKWAVVEEEASGKKGGGR